MQAAQGPQKDPVVLAAGEEHVQFCFDVLSSHFSGSSGPVAYFDEAVCPLFVTWNKEDRRGGTRLRGCIGTLQARNLRTALREYALTSSLKDRRFPPVTSKELPLLHCTVSLLSAFEQAQDWLSWVIGLHGLIIEFDDHMTGHKRSATFLPEVAAHENWTQQQTIDALIRKAGFSGSVTDDLRSSLRITRYRSTTASLTYAEYMQRVMSSNELQTQMKVASPSCVPVPA
ncbi:hypothetical protein WJX73_005137 [Symbiochloris irregularis]|uniref:AMMECR1 domain-containing protein n=1 Tax=Symbiochloris irregularis TaxID=706552 RepID=A0AAW1PTT7_9CHLO